jgi:hypothetical protein
LLGNPRNAPVKLVEYISYTCPHCAHFEAESDAQLRIGFIATGKGSIEVRKRCARSHRPDRRAADPIAGRRPSSLPTTAPSCAIKRHGWPRSRA